MLQTVFTLAFSVAFSCYVSSDFVFPEGYPTLDNYMNVGGGGGGGVKNVLVGGNRLLDNFQRVARKLKTKLHPLVIFFSIIVYNRKNYNGRSRNTDLQNKKI